ncbi:hypothetical protein B6U82_00235 [Candidatus Pacearchaeota archaeon ex4484_31]|nr:MAG: hypothetical protein B6U82_00235 [Candidatus Pacearchaeota archaeon ex4484_31]
MSKFSRTFNHSRHFEMEEIHLRKFKLRNYLHGKFLPKKKQKVFHFLSLKPYCFILITKPKKAYRKKVMFKKVKYLLV